MVNGLPSLSPNLSSFFSMYDVDGNGWIDLPEMTKIVRSIYRMTGPKCGGGESYETPEVRAASIFKRMDVNSDGKVTRQEFVTTCLDDQQLIGLLTPNVRWSPYRPPCQPCAWSSWSGLTNLQKSDASGQRRRQIFGKTSTKPVRHQSASQTNHFHMLLNSRKYIYWLQWSEGLREFWFISAQVVRIQRWSILNALAALYYPCGWVVVAL